MGRLALTDEEINDRIKRIVENQTIRNSYTEKINELSKQRAKYTRRVNIDENSVLRHYRFTGEPIPEYVKEVLDKPALCKGRPKTPSEELVKTAPWRPKRKTSKPKVQSAAATTPLHIQEEICFKERKLTHEK